MVGNTQLRGNTLSDKSIIRYLNNDDIIIHPILDPDEQIQGAKVDLRLGTKILILQSIDTSTLEPWHPLHYYKEYIVPLGNPLIIHPGEFILAPTFETIKIPNWCVGQLEGRSSLGRLGIIVHATASLIDPGFSGVITLEITNLSRVAVPLLPLMRIAAITFTYVDDDVQKPYLERKTAKYKNPIFAGASEISGDLEMDTIRTLVPKDLHERYQHAKNEIERIRSEWNEH